LNSNYQFFDKVNGIISNILNNLLQSEHTVYILDCFLISNNFCVI